MKQKNNNSKTLIIAEAGVNHNGDIETAKKLIRQAAIAGADIVKFQTFTADKLLTSNAPKADYQVDLDEIDMTSYQMLKNLELSKDDHLILIEESQKNNIEFFSTAFDEANLNFLIDLGMSRIKIPSGEITNKPLLTFISQFDMPVIMSTGMADLSEIESAINVLSCNKLTKNNISILHCTSEYPANFNDINLHAIRSMKDNFGLDVGYSDHTLGSEASIAAVSLGATIIEKHITLDSNMAGPDHKASMEPGAFKAMVAAIRNIEKGLGDGIKKPTESELEMRPIARKSLVANHRIQKGDIFTPENIAIKRPGNGISPMQIDKILGTKSKHSFEESDLIKL
jgi:N,N'-diacetyllegionaminate synthase